MITTLYRLRALLLLLLPLVWLAPASAQVADPVALEQLVSDTMREQQIPAITVAIGKGDRLIYSKGFGRADLENSVPATPETLIRTASIAKSISAVAAMTLVESGRLNLDAPVQTYCAPFPPKQRPI